MVRVRVRPLVRKRATPFRSTLTFARKLVLAHASVTQDQSNKP